MIFIDYLWSFETSLKVFKRSLKVFKSPSEEDAVDRLHYKFTICILILFATFTGSLEYFGDPVQCWVPAQFTGPWKQYVDTYCFVESTYYAPLHEDIHVVKNQPHGPTRITYYQWVPLVLFLQSVMFFLPRLIWKVLNWQSGIDLRTVLGVASTKHLSIKVFNNAVNAIAIYVRTSVEIRKSVKSGSRGIPNYLLSFGRNSGCYINALYILVKTLFLANIIAQFFILKDFLGLKSDFWGFTVFRDLLAGKSWNGTVNFPRVTFCDFQVSEFGNVHDHTVQCVMPINMFLEKIYLFIWWWFFLVTVVTVPNLFYWLYISFSLASRKKFIRDLLTLGDRSFEDDDKQPQINEFVQVLQPDGVFMARLMCKIAGDGVTSDVLRALYNKFFHLRPSSPPTTTTNRKEVSDNAANAKVSFQDDNNLDTTINKILYPSVKQTVKQGVSCSA